MTLPLGATNYTLPDGCDQPLAEETPVALVFDGVTQAVMMATPRDFHDFLIGFALTEGVISAASELSDLEVVLHDQGVEVRGWLNQGAGEVFRRRRRAMAGPVGCGLCGIDSLEQALRPLAHTRGDARLPTADVAAQALDALRSGQVLKDATRATHAAAFWTVADGVVALREDVGRHNALDKLAGALAQGGIDPAAGVVVMTSRLSVDLVQKTVMMGAGAIVAPSSPTALAIREAEAAGLIVYARAEGGMARYTGAR